jgi:uncharacterized protein YoxC
MFTEICLAIISVSLVVLLVFFIRVFPKVANSIHQVQIDLNRVSTETTLLASSLNEFVRSDLYKVSEQTSELIEKLTDLTSDLTPILHPFSRLFKPSSFLSSKEEKSPTKETIPQILNWVVTSLSLIKKTREFIKNHE